MDAILDLINNAEIAHAHTEIEHTEIEAPAPSQERHYWKCSDCLRPFVVVGKAVPEMCSCGGKVYYMGKVMGKNYYGHTEMTCECNEVCACATGPNCSCACGGMNHGKGLTVELQVIDGKMAVATTNTKHEARAVEYRNALAAAQARFNAKHGEDVLNISNGVRIPLERWHAVQRVNNQILAAKRCKLHKDRITKLTNILPDVQVDTPKSETPKHTLF